MSMCMRVSVCVYMHARTYEHASLKSYILSLLFFSNHKNSAMAGESIRWAGSLLTLMECDVRKYIRE